MKRVRAPQLSKRYFVFVVCMCVSVRLTNIMCVCVCVRMFTNRKRVRRKTQTWPCVNLCLYKATLITIYAICTYIKHICKENVSDTHMHARIYLNMYIC